MVKAKITGTGKYSTANVKHTAAGEKYSFAKGEEIMSDTPAKVITYLEKLNLVGPKPTVDRDGKEDSDAK